MIDHGIDQGLMEEVFRQSQKFFDLPLHEKMKLLRNKKHRGYIPFLDETSNPGNQISGWYFIFSCSLFSILLVKVHFLPLTLCRLCLLVIEKISIWLDLDKS